MMYPNNTGTVSIIIGTASLALVGGYFYVELQNPSPGNLSTVHAQVAELDNGKNCAACHGDGTGGMRQACAKCHEAIDQQIAGGTGLHGQLDASIRGQCANCHSEHHGAQFPITNQQSFALAGLADLAQFNHANFDFRLRGRHTALACPQCHSHAAAPVLPIGAQRFTGLSQNCQSCHQDVHRGEYGLDCQSCHGQDEPFDRAAQFQHTDAFPLTGSHAGLRCKQCHDGSSSVSIVALIERRATGSITAAPRSCSACHESPHSAKLLDVVASQLPLGTASLCEVCHTPIHASFKHPQATISAKFHALIGFPLDPPHQNVACRSCHAETGTSSRNLTANVPRSPDDCAVCHDDPHFGQFSESIHHAAKNCVACHARERFTPSLFDRNHHGQSRFPLHGAHAQIDCAHCHGLQRLPVEMTHHSLGDTWVRVFRGVPTNCRGCHQDPHQGQFQHGSFAQADCSTCHDEHSFQPSTFSLTQHETTVFPLTGAHQAVGCNQCHVVPSPDDRRSAQNAEILAIANRVFRGTPTRCDVCHDDVHRGAFAKLETEEPHAARTDCAACHTTDDFRNISERAFDHERSTGFALRGAHGKAQCAACHLPTEDPDGAGRSLGFAAGRNCQDCHRDPHANQFGRTADVRCTACHTDGHSFRELVFDHQRDSRFQLDDVHGRLECTACHRPESLTNGEMAIRYKPLGIECADCHWPQTRPPRSRLK